MIQPASTIFCVYDILRSSLPTIFCFYNYTLSWNPRTTSSSVNASLPYTYSSFHVLVLPALHPTSTSGGAASSQFFYSVRQLQYVIQRRRRGFQALFVAPCHFNSSFQFIFTIQRRRSGFQASFILLTIISAVTVPWPFSASFLLRSRRVLLAAS